MDSAFYGPGAIGGWCFIAISVLAGWLYRESHLLNMLTMLTPPSIAAGHALWSAAHSTSYTTQWHIRQAFSQWGYALLSICTLCGRWKRAGFIALPVALCTFVVRYGGIGPVVGYPWILRGDITYAGAIPFWVLFGRAIPSLEQGGAGKPFFATQAAYMLWLVIVLALGPTLGSWQYLLSAPIRLILRTMAERSLLDSNQATLLLFGACAGIANFILSRNSARVALPSRGKKISRLVSDTQKLERLTND